MRYNTLWLWLLIISFSFLYSKSFAGLTTKGNEIIYTDNDNSIKIHLDKMISEDSLFKHHQKVIKQIETEHLTQHRTYMGNNTNIETKVTIQSLQIIKIRGLIAFITKTTDKDVFLSFRCVHYVRAPKLSKAIPFIATETVTRFFDRPVTLSEFQPQLQNLPEALLFDPETYNMTPIHIWYTVPLHLHENFFPLLLKIQLKGFTNWSYEFISEH